jgi:hypothetical protein
VSRFRLRFLLQEFDLSVGEVLIGRSPDCQITIEDPLISRQHAKIIVSQDVATYVDLGSRNGSRINGRAISGATPLRDSDRIRLGAQELVFFQVGSETRPPRQTGAMLFCRKCATPFPEGARVCPHCGEPPGEAREDETMSGLIIEPRRTWMLQLFGEVLERALTSGKVDDAERILRRAADEFGERVAAGDPVDQRQLLQIADYALRLAAQQKDGKWARWTLEMFRTVERVPSPQLIDRLIEVKALPGVGAALHALVEYWRERGATLSSNEIFSLGRLDELARVAEI